MFQTKKSKMMRKFHPDLLEKVRPGFQSELIETDETGKEWWTAKYNDPLSGQTFDAGTLLHIPVSAEDGAARSTRIIDENVCYDLLGDVLDLVFVSFTQDEEERGVPENVIKLQETNVVEILQQVSLIDVLFT